MKIRVRFFANLREVFHTREMIVKLDKGTTVRGALETICDSPGKRKEIFNGDKLNPYMIVLRNGRHIQHLDGLETVLNEEDELSVFPPVAGG